MNPVDALVAIDRRILVAYSRRTTDALRAVLPLRIALPRIEPFLALNVAKEVQKDALVIRRAQDALRHGTSPGDAMYRQLYQATREIDHAFLARVRGLPVGIVIRYEEIEPIRLRRIERLLAAAYIILERWPKGKNGREALQASFPRVELQQLIHDLLRLYALETQALSRSLRLPALLVPLRDGIARNLYRIMNEVGGRMARDLVVTVYRHGRN
ncbi:MAG: hypothetical protein QMD17_07885 [Rhodocyclaceae bacterium]|jgi:hypothetical protein|nr:hypothetical protein [Rhodocyclaceae bacterium]